MCPGPDPATQSSQATQQAYSGGVECSHERKVIRVTHPISLAYAPRLQRLRALVDNGRLLPHLTGKRLLSCELRRVPSYFKPTRATTKKDTR